MIRAQRKVTRIFQMDSESLLPLTNQFERSYQKTHFAAFDSFNARVKCRLSNVYSKIGKICKKRKKKLRVGESNPGLPRDRRGYLPLY